MTPDEIVQMTTRVLNAARLVAFRMRSSHELGCRLCGHDVPVPWDRFERELVEAVECLQARANFPEPIAQEMKEAAA